jgi:hypothetical protein
VHSPDPAVQDVLNGVAALSARSAWAVGDASHSASSVLTLIVRWNGKAWKQVPSPSPAGRDVLSGVAALSTRSAWAVGATFIGPFGSPGNARTLIVHWNGTSWK